MPKANRTYRLVAFAIINNKNLKMSILNNYSDWLKIDLHIHTNKSNLVKPNDYDGAFDLAVLKQKLIENEVKIFSLTDHNIINIEAYKKYYDTYVDGDPVLLVGCEFDIKVKQEDDTYLTYHTLLIFDENTKEKALEINNLIEGHFIKNNISKFTKSKLITSLLNTISFDKQSAYRILI